ncbi:MAG: hypothetical protein AAGA93_00925 [Actinomycetota bacterium]
MIGFVARRLWRLLGRRLGWMALAAAARTLLRRDGSRRVDEASSELEQKLPDRVVMALDAMPGDPLRRGGQAVVAGRSARRVATGAGQATRAADRGRRRVAGVFDRAAEVVDARPRPVSAGRALGERFGFEVRDETDRAHRELRSEMLRHSRGRTAADDALLDRRNEPDNVIDVEAAAPIAEPPEPIRRGRFRAPRRLAASPVARVQRTYQRPRRPWDR